MDAATRSVAAHLGPGTLVSYETTLPVGTTRGRYRPLIEGLSGLREGRDFDVVFSPSGFSRAACSPTSLAIRSWWEA